MKANYIGTLETYWIILKHTISHTKYQKEDKEQYVRNVLIMAEQLIKHEIKSYILDWRISSKIFLLYKGNIVQVEQKYRREIPNFIIFAASSDFFAKGTG